MSLSTSINGCPGSDVNRSYYLRRRCDSWSATDAGQGMKECGAPCLDRRSASVAAELLNTQRRSSPCIDREASGLYVRRANKRADGEASALGKVWRRFICIVRSQAGQTHAALILRGDCCT